MQKIASKTFACQLIGDNESASIDPFQRLILPTKTVQLNLKPDRIEILSAVSEQQRLQKDPQGKKLLRSGLPYTDLDSDS